MAPSAPRPAASTSRSVTASGDRAGVLMPRHRPPPRRTMVEMANVMAEKRGAGRRRDLVGWLYLLAFLVGAALVLGFMWYHIANERRVAMDHWHARLSTFADDRARLVSDWLQSRKADAEVLA